MNAGDDADWLWGRLMDWCRSRGIQPATHNDLFDIVGGLRARQIVNGQPSAPPAAQTAGEVMKILQPDEATIQRYLQERWPNTTWTFSATSWTRQVVRSLDRG